MSSPAVLALETARYGSLSASRSVSAGPASGTETGGGVGAAGRGPGMKMSGGSRSGLSTGPSADSRTSIDSRRS